MSRYAGILEAANGSYSDRLDALSEAKNPMADEVVKLIHDKRAAIKANDRKLEGKLNKQIAAMTVKMARPSTSKLARELKSWLKSKEKELKKELAGLPVRLIVYGGRPYLKGSNISPQAARASFEIEFILDPVTEAD